jgi:hypothetical protein
LPALGGQRGARSALRRPECRPPRFAHWRGPHGPYAGLPSRTAPRWSGPSWPLPRSQCQSGPAPAEVGDGMALHVDAGSKGRRAGFRWPIRLLRLRLSRPDSPMSVA